MELTVAQGRTIRLPAEFYLGELPTDPDRPRVYVLDPSNQPVIVRAVPQRDGPGIYYLDYQVALNAPAGIWTVRWTAALEGRDVSGEDAFEVTVPRRVDSPEHIEPPEAPAPHPPAPPAGIPGRQSESANSGPPSPTAAGAAVVPPQVEPHKRPLRLRRRRTGRKSELADVAVAPEAAVNGKKGAQKGRRGRSGSRPRAKTQGPARRNGVMAAALLLCLAAVAMAGFRIRDGVGLSESQRSFQLADEALRQGAIDKARSHYLDVLLDDPDNKTAFFDLGMLAHVQNRGAEAQDYYLRALRTDPNYLPALFNLAILKEADGRVDEAILLYRKILNRSPQNAASHFNLGLILYNKKGDQEEGRKQIQEAVRLDPTLAARAAEAFK